MRYFGDDDEFEDDTYDEDDAIDVDADDDDDEDEESGQSRSRVNPFSGRPAATPSSGAPGAGRTNLSGSGSGPSSASRLPGSVGRPTTGNPAQSGGSNPPRYGAGSSGSGSNPPASTSGSRFGGSGSSGGSNPPASSSGSRFGGSGTSGGSNPPASSSGSRFGGSGQSSSGSNPPASSSGSRFGGSGSSGGSNPPASTSGSRFGGSGQSSSGSNPPASSSGSRFGGSGQSSSGSNPPASSSGSRFGGSGQSSSASSAPKSDAKSGGIGGRLGGLASGLTNRGKDSSSSSRPSAPKSSGGGIGGRLGGIAAGLRGGKSNQPKSASGSSSSFRPGSSSGVSGSSTARPGTSGSAASAPKRPFLGSLGGGGASSGAQSGTKGAKASSGGLGRFLPFGRGDAGKKPAPSARPRTSKAPKVQGEGLSLDNKLDILGVALVLGSLALFFSTLSATKGQLTESVNRFLAQVFGWGAIAIPVAMMVVGVWLIARHFGDDAQIVPITRIVGVIMVYIGVLIVMQFIDTFSYVNPDGLPPSLQSLRDGWLPVAIDRGSGGGWVGANIYYLLVANITEFGAFFAMVGWLIIGAMFTLSISAAELAMILISVGRSFGDARHQRAQRRAAAMAALQAQQMAAGITAPALTVSREQPEALPGGQNPALPAVTSAPLDPARAERNIAINVGGRTLASPYDNPELVPVTNKPGQVAAQSTGAPASGGSALGSRLRGFGLGGRTAGDKSSDDKVTEPTPQPTTGGIRGRLFGRGNAAEPPEVAKSGADQKSPASPDIAAGLGAVGAVAMMSSAPNDAHPRRDVSPVAEEPARLSDLMRPAGEPVRASAAPGAFNPATPRAPINPASTGGAPVSGRPSPSGSPFARAVANEAPKPVEAESPPLPPQKTAEELEAERMASLPPAKPRGNGPVPRPEEANRTRFGVSSFGTPKPGAEPPTPAERQDRLNALRSGGMNPAEKPLSDDSAAAPDNNIAAAASVGAGSERESNGTPPTKTPQPAAAFWKQGAENNGGAILAKEESKPPASSFGRPTVPPGVAEPRSAPVASAPPPSGPIINTPRPAEPPPKSAGVGVNAPAGAKRRKEWKLPNTSNLLMPGSEQDFDRESLLKRARLIEDTLQSFGAPGKVVEVNTGPVITQFGVEPDYLVQRGGKKNRVKVGAIAQLDKDLQLALGAKSIRIEAPVPGKGYVGIEVPNEEASLVSLRDVMESEEYKKIDSPLTIALGQSVDGTPVSADLSSMPHLLVAGTTGSGKSVLVNAIITSLLIRNTPDEVKFIMVDPKRVELTGYNGIPHLVAPVVVELERIVGVLKWVTREMDERYKRFSNAGARNIEDFNNHLPENDERMPYIVVIIDELADLMMLAPDETERVITRIAALARATGIHLVIATQRPSVDVVTGLIKANFPARIAFAVAGGVDSRVILDQPGAEKLLGRGDMLYMSGDSPSALRLQGVFVSDTEINNIVRYWRTQVSEDDVSSRPISQLVLDNTVVESSRRVSASGNSRSQVQQAFWDRDSSPSSSVTSGLGSDSDDSNDSVDDELYEHAVEMVRRLNKASVSLLQRRLRIGYTRAARLIDLMEEQGIVGPATEGSKPREVLPLS